MVIKNRAITAMIGTSFFVASLCSISAPALAQASDIETTYSNVLEQIANKTLTLAQSEAYVETQSARIASLRDQLSQVNEVSASVDPMLAKMVTAIEGQIRADIPFKSGERLARLDKLRTDIASEEVSVGEKMRRAFQIYDIEVAYGSSLEAYKGNHPMPDKAGARFAACEADTASAACNLTKEMGEALAAGTEIRKMRDDITDGDYLRYGRLALSYMQHDESEAFRYDVESQSWVPLTAGQMIELRRGLRTARGEAAPTVVKAPLYITN